MLGLLSCWLWGCRDAKLQRHGGLGLLCSLDIAVDGGLWGCWVVGLRDCRIPGL